MSTANQLSMFQQPSTETPDTPVLFPTDDLDVRLGDLWACGQHRVLCADSTDGASMARLVGDVRPDMVFTDPPYNVGGTMEHGLYEIRDEKEWRTKYKNPGGMMNALDTLAKTAWDKAFDISAFLDVLSGYRPVNGTVYICASHITAPAIWVWGDMQKATHNSYCVWLKPTPMPSLMKRHPTWATELICYATFGKHVFNFPDSGHALNYWLIQGNTEQRQHPTQKPLAVPLRAIRYSSNPGQMILDPFLGSGTTLLACEQTGRICLSSELSAEYVRIALTRWWATTGRKPTLLERVVP